MKIIITESQAALLKEALGVPNNILEAAEKLYKIIEDHLRTITLKSDQYNFSGSLDIQMGDKKIIEVEEYNLTVNVEEIDEYKGTADISSMGVGTSFMFDRNLLMQRREITTDLDLTITFVVSPEWEPKELVEKMEQDKNYQVASLAHELKHKYDKQAKEIDLIGPTAEYQAIQQISKFGIPAIDQKFFRYLYFISMSENLVRNVEVASQMRSANVTKSGFKDFIENERVYSELMEIKKYTFDVFIDELHQQMNRVEALLDYIDFDYSDMSDDEKIEKVLEFVYIDSVNKKMEIFNNMTSENTDFLIDMAGMFGQIPPALKTRAKQLERTNEVRRKFMNYAIRYQNNPIKFFEDEIENFNYVANKYIKKIIKLYYMAKDDETMTESIQNWDLHQKLMEKKYGKRKISTTYKYKNFK
jgi:hypothetical protein